MGTALRFLWQLEMGRAGIVSHSQKTQGNGNLEPVRPSLSSHSGSARRRQLTHSRPHSPSPPQWSRPARYQRSCSRGELSSCWRSAGSDEGRAAGGQGGVNSSGHSALGCGRCAHTDPTHAQPPVKTQPSLSHAAPLPRARGRAGEAGRCGGRGGAATPGQPPALANRRLAARIGSRPGAGRAAAEADCAPPPEPAPARRQRVGSAGARLGAAGGAGGGGPAAGRSWGPARDTSPALATAPPHPARPDWPGRGPGPRLQRRR